MVQATCPGGFRCLLLLRRTRERQNGGRAWRFFPMLPAVVRVMSWIVSSSHPAVPRYSILLSLLMGAMSLQCALDRTAQAVSATESVWSLCLWTMPAVVSNVMAGGVSIGMVVTIVLRGVWKSWVYREPVRRMLLSCTMGGNLRSGLTSSEIAWHVERLAKRVDRHEKGPVVRALPWIALPGLFMRHPVTGHRLLSLSHANGPILHSAAFRVGPPSLQATSPKRRG